MEASWQAERARLRPLPERLPEPFDLAVTRPVQRDCTVSFEGRPYSVPFVLCGLRVEVRGGAEVVQVLKGEVVAGAPAARPRLVLDPGHYDGPATAGWRRRCLWASWAAGCRRFEAPVEQRPLDLYAALAEVAR